MHVNIYKYVLVYETGGMELKLRIFLTISVPNSHFIALATLIAEKHAPGTQTVTGWPQTSL